MMLLTESQSSALPWPLSLPVSRLSGAGLIRRDILDKQAHYRWHNLERCPWRVWTRSVAMALL